MDWETEQSSKNLHDTRWWGRCRYILLKNLSLFLSLSLSLSLHLKENLGNYFIKLHCIHIIKQSIRATYKVSISRNMYWIYQIGNTFKIDVEYEFHFQSVECAWTWHCMSKPSCSKYPCNCCWLFFLHLIEAKNNFNSWHVWNSAIFFNGILFLTRKIYITLKIRE